MLLEKKESELVKPSEYPRLFCPQCGCVNDIKQGLDNFTIEEAWRAVDKHLYFSQDYPNVTDVEFHAKGFCKHCMIRFDMTLEHIQPNKKKKRKEKSSSQ
jgi:hypothetical protein